MKTKVWQYIKKHYIYFLTISLLIPYLFVQQCTKQALRDKVQLQAVELATIKDTVLTYKNKAGELTFKFNSIQVTSNNTKKALVEAGFEINGLKQDNIKWRDLTLALKMKLEASGGGTITLHDTIPVKGDSIPAKVGKWNNEHLWLWPYLTGNKLDFKYKYQTGIELFQEQKGKSYVITAKLSDLNATIVTGNSITIVPKKHWYTSPIVWGAVGLVGGFFIAK